MFRSNLAQKKVERCHLVIEVVKENASKRCIAIVPDPSNLVRWFAFHRQYPSKTEDLLEKHEKP